LAASADDLRLWSSFRHDIADYVHKGKIWYQPDSRQLIELCPWLRKDSNSGRYLCDIYLDRPEDCRTYPATLADMINDDCEMLEPSDLLDLSQAQKQLDRMNIESD